MTSNVPNGATLFARADHFGAVGLSRGPGDTMWIADKRGSAIERVSTTGVVTTYKSPLISHPTGITAGPDGAMWFTNSVGLPRAYYGSIGRIGLNGTISSYGAGKVDVPTSIVTGPGGNLWFTQAGGIGRVTPAGVVTVYAVPRIGGEFVENNGNIVVGPDDHLWFTGYRAVTKGSKGGGPWRTALIRMDSVGKFTEFVVGPREASGSLGLNARPGFVVSGADHRLWVDAGRHTIDAVTVHGHQTRYSSRLINAPQQLAAGSKGVWFANSRNLSIERISTKGVVSHRLPLPDIAPHGLAIGPDHRLWFSNDQRGAVGTVSTSGRVRLIAPFVDQPYLMTPGGHGDLWYVNHGNDSLARIAPNHHIEEYFGTDVSGITGLQWGIDRSMWFIRGDRDEVGRITDAGHVTLRKNHALANPVAITVGPRHDAWVLAQGGNAVVRVTPAGRVRVFRVPKRLATSSWITAGSDGNLWLIGGQATAGVGVARMTPSGVFTAFACGCSGPPGLPFLGPDGAIWFMTGYGSSEAVRVAANGSIRRQRLGAVGDTLAVTVDGNLHFISLNATGTSGLYLTLAMASGPFGGKHPNATTPPNIHTRALVGRVHLTDPRNTYGRQVAIDDHLYSYSPIDPDLNTAVVGPDGKVWFTGSGAILYTD